jgi:hypothetical protein
MLDKLLLKSKRLQLHIRYVSVRKVLLNVCEGSRRALVEQEL